MPAIRAAETCEKPAADAGRVSIAVCIATMRRPSIEATLRSLAAQRLPTGVELGIVVADNDETPSARPLIEAVARSIDTPVTYLHAPARNISLARNACLDAADADWVAFIDDDESAPPDWLARLLGKARQDGLDVVFGPALAEYPPDSPGWMTRTDYHSNHPVRRGGTVQTGHTCNALMRAADPRIAGQRFRLDKGRSGGEDTEFFYRLWKSGLVLGICEEAPVHEPVDPGRLSFRWIARRKFRAGQSFAFHYADAALARRAFLVVAAAAKAVFCGFLALATAPLDRHRNFWALRGVMHCGVWAGLVGVREPELYGGAEPSARARAQA